MKKRAILLTLLILTLIIFDQLTKWLVITNIKENSITVIQNILNFTYVENKGVAFGINSNGGISNIIISIFIIIIIIRFMVKQREMTNKFTNISLALILAGGFGNLIDRIFRGYVVDYIDITRLFDYPIFNFADICIVVGVILVITVIIVNTVKDQENIDEKV